MKSGPHIVFPPYRLDLTTAQLWRDTHLLSLRPKIFAVLRYLIAHAGELVTKAALVQAVWPDTYGSGGLPKGCIRELRAVLGDSSERPQFIETVGRRGYRWIAPLTTAPLVQSPRSKVQSLHSSPSHPFTPSSSLVGRDAELVQLHDWLKKAQNGERQVVFVTGEPGIGKTTLVDAFLAHVEQVQGPKSKVSKTTGMKQLASP
ncbi:MAG: winged helix-turn-helix domain-containing protein, partial [Candidatus Binatia bacterium]